MLWVVKGCGGDCSWWWFEIVVMEVEGSGHAERQGREDVGEGVGTMEK